MYTVELLARYCGAQVIGHSESAVEKILFDSRKTFVPHNTLFVAIKSRSNDGHQFIDDLYRKGIRLFLVEREADIPFEQYPEASFLIVENSVHALQLIAANIRQQKSYPLIGITGSNGKTIVKEWLGKLLESQFKIGKSPRSFNSQIGVPVSIWMLADDLDYAIIEAGISQPGEMQNIAECIQPDFGVITNIGQAHQENFKSLKEKLEEKLKLFKNANTLFFHYDDALVRTRIRQKYQDKKLVSWGEDKAADLQLLSKRDNSKQTLLEVRWKDEVFELDVPFQDGISIENTLLSVLVALELGVEINRLQNVVKELQPIAMRLEQKEGINNCLLIDDGYNSDLTSLELGLDFLQQMGSKRGLSKTLILSDIYQSGISNDQLFNEIQRLRDQYGIRKFIGIGNELFRLMNGVDAYESTEAFIKSVDINAFRDEAILLKGSRDFTFERISALLEMRRHKTVLEINLNALADNVKYFRSLLKKETKLLAMVKAFSYGTGSFEIANLLQQQKVDYLGVAFADEGIELRKAGITLPIIVMNPELSSFSLMLEYELEPEVYSFQVLKAFLAAVNRQGLTNVPIHIKVDTGMNRLGFLPQELDELSKQLNATTAVRVRSVFSHLAGSDEAIHDGFTDQQIEKLTQACSKLQDRLGYSFIRHILNSAGIERFPNAQFDMVRLGIGMYGVSATGNTILKQVNTLKSYVSQLKMVQAGETIGYSRKGISTSPLQIAIIPIGYADGYNRRLSNSVGEVYINGQKAPIVGNICMDMCMADVTNIEVNEGDEVEIFGENLTIYNLAKKLDTIPYEILTSISRRVKRVYVME